MIIKPTISIYLPSLHGGGAERVMVYLANGFAERGFSVDLVLVKAEGPFLKEVDNTVRVVNLNRTRVIRSLWPLIRYLRNQKPTVMLSALGHANIVACLARRLSGVKTRLVISEHYVISQELVSDPAGRIMLWLMRRVYPWAEGIVAVSRGAADDLIQELALDATKVHAIYNPVVHKNFISKINESLDHPWFANGEPPIILSVGRLTKEKDFSTLIRAFSLIRATQAIRLVILGEGDIRNQLEQLVNDLELQSDVQLPGFVSNPYAYMARATLFVMSSEREGFGNVLVEAMACGRPVISTDCPTGPREILENGRWGKLVPVGNVQALTDAILETLKQTKFPDVAFRASKFDVDNALDRYSQVLQLGTVTL